MKKINKYDLIIYSCLFLAIICLVIGGKDYMDSLNTKSDLKDEVKYAINNINPPEEEITENDTEPETLSNLDKNNLIISYLDSIQDRISKNSFITPETINSWGSYEIVDITYDRSITSSYYKYIVNIKISNKEGTIPGTTNKDLSTEENPVLVLNIYIEYQKDSNSYIVKHLDI